MTYNVHSCVGNDRRLAPERIAEVIASSRSEVVCLQELDAGRKRTGLIRQAETLARELDMQFHFFPAIRAASEEYGDAILSRHPLRVVRTGALPQPSSMVEPRGALWVEVETEGAKWQVINTHLGLGRGERRAQACALAAWIAAAQAARPVVFCGDLNSRSGSAVHQLLGNNLRDAQTAANGGMKRTFSTRLPWICLDYIYVSTDVHVRSAQVLMTPLARIASDHFPLVAELELIRGSVTSAHAANGSTTNHGYETY